MRLLHQMGRDELFTKTEIAVRDYVLTHRDEVLSMSTDDIARANYVSKATLTRFAKKLGLSGWNELKLQFAREASLAQQDGTAVDINFPYDEQSNIRQIADSLISLKTSILKHCFNSIEPNSIVEAIDLLEKQKRIYIFAEGYSLHASDDFCFRMTRIGKLVNNQSDIGIRYIARALDSQDLGIIVSYTGLTESVVESFRVLMRNNVPTIAITSEDPNPIGDNATISIPLPREEDIYSKLGNYSSVDSMRAVFDLLYSGYVARNPISVTKRINAAKRYDAKMHPTKKRDVRQ